MFNKELWKSLKENNAESRHIQQALAAIIVLFLLTCFLVSLSQPIENNDRVIINQARNLAEQGKLLDIRPTNYLYIKALLYSFTYKPTRGYEEGTRVLMMRSVGAVLGALIVFFVYLLAKQFQPRRQLLMLAAPAILAFNPRFIELMIAIDGNQIILLLIAALLFELGEIVANKNEIKLLDIGISFLIIYALSRLFPNLATTFGLPLLIIAITGAFLIGYREPITSFIKNNKIIALGGLAATAALILFFGRAYLDPQATQNGLRLLRSVSMIPAAAVKSAAFLSQFSLGEGFFYLNTIYRFVIYLSGVVAIIGVAMFLIYRRQTDERADFDVSLAILIFLFLAIALLLFNSNSESINFITNLYLELIMIPVVVIFSFGLINSLKIKAAAIPFELSLGAVFIADLAVILIRILFVRF